MGDGPGTGVKRWRERGALRPHDRLPAADRAGVRSDREPQHVGGPRIAEPVAHVRDALVLRDAGVGRLLPGTLVGTQAWLLVHLGAGIPQRELARHVAGDRL